MLVSLIEPLNVPKELIEELAQPIKEAGHQFTYYDSKWADEAELLKRTDGSDIIMLANTPISEEVIARNPNLKLINVAFTGVDHVPVKKADEKGIKVCNAAGYANTAVAELAIAMALSLYREIGPNERDLRMAENYPGAIIGQEIRGKTVGIIGTGLIGMETARLFKAFGANLLGYDQVENAEANEIGMTYGALDEVLQQSDIVSLHLPLNDSTRHIINAEKLRQMKSSAILINIARGPIIKMDDLVGALKNEEIAGAGLDVYDIEPPLSADEPILEAPNVVLTPHIGYYTKEAMAHRARIAFDNTMNFINGEPSNLVQP